RAYRPGARLAQESPSAMGEKPAAPRRRMTASTAWNGVADSARKESRSSSRGSITRRSYQDGHFFLALAFAGGFFVAFGAVAAFLGLAGAGGGGGPFFAGFAGLAGGGAFPCFDGGAAAAAGFLLGGGGAFAAAFAFLSTAPFFFVGAASSS